MRTKQTKLPVWILRLQWTKLRDQKYLLLLVCVQLWWSIYIYDADTIQLSATVADSSVESRRYNSDCRRNSTVVRTPIRRRRDGDSTVGVANSVHTCYATQLNV